MTASTIEKQTSGSSISAPLGPAAPTHGHPVWRTLQALILLLWTLGGLRYYWHQGEHRTAVLGLTLLLLTAGAWQLRRHSSRFTPSGATLWPYLLAEFLPEHLLGGSKTPNPHVIPALLALVWIAAAVLFDRRRRFPAFFPRAESFLERRATVILGCFSVLYCILGSWLAIRKLRCFGYVGQDVAYFMQCLYTGLHGHLFWSNQYHDLLYTRTVYSDFAGHNQPVLFLLLPLYLAFPHAETLFISRNIILALSCFPAFQLCRMVLPAFPSLLITCAYLMAPAVLFQNVYDYAPLSLIALPLLWALVFYGRKRFIPFAVALAACLLIREDLVVAAVGLGLLALIERRSVRWGALPIALGVGWAILTWRFLLPHFQHGATSAVQSCFAYLGSTPMLMFKTLLAHPTILLTHNTVSYLALIFTPLGVILPFWSPASLISLPYLLINVLGDKGCDAAIIFRHYALIPTIFLLPGVIRAVRSLSTGRAAWNASASAWATLILVSCVSTTALTVSATELGWWGRSPWQTEATKVALSLPQSASVAVPRYMLPLVANRTFVYQSLRLLDYHHPDAEYIVLDRDAARSGVSAKTVAPYIALLHQLADSNHFQVTYESANYLVFRRLGAISLRSAAGSGAHSHE